MPKDSVLIVDSDKNTLTFLTGMLVEKGFKRSMGITTGEGITDIIDEKKPDIVLLNIDIKGENSIDILSRVKAKNPDIPVIILARPDCREAAEAAIRKGASSCIIQTGTEDDIAQALKDQLQRHRQEVSRGKCDILIIDDDLDILDMVKSYLQSNDYKCETVSNPGKAVNKLLSVKPKLVLLDIVMPDIDGIDLLNEIKKKDPKVKVIMMSGIADRDICINAIKNGASGYITKPFSLQQLKVTLTTTLFR